MQTQGRLSLESEPGSEALIKTMGCCVMIHRETKCSAFRSMRVHNCRCSDILHVVEEHKMKASPLFGRMYARKTSRGLIALDIIPVAELKISGKRVGFWLMSLLTDRRALNLIEAKRPEADELAGSASTRFPSLVQNAMSSRAIVLYFNEQKAHFC